MRIAWEEVSFPCVEMSDFENAILEYVFSIPYDERGKIMSYWSSQAVETERGFYDRVTGFCSEKDSKKYYFFVFAQTPTHDLSRWVVTARTVIEEGEFRIPDLKQSVVHISFS